MKTKKTFISIFTLCIALLLTACSTKEAPEASDTQLDDLYQQENQLFADHDDEWNKVFGMMNKNTADPNGNYADYLADTIESNKTSFTDDELKIYLSISLTPLTSSMHLVLFFVSSPRRLPIPAASIIACMK